MCLMCGACVAQVLLGGGQDASQVTTTSAKAGGFEARFFHKVCVGGGAAGFRVYRQCWGVVGTPSASAGLMSVQMVCWGSKRGDGMGHCG